MRILPIHDTNIDPDFHALFTAGNDSPFYTEALAFTAFCPAARRRRSLEMGTSTDIPGTASSHLAFPSSRSMCM